MTALRYVLLLIVVMQLALADPAPEVSSQPARVAQSRGKRIREKEAEGSQAPNRFEGDPVIKSKYELNGQPLEVDPD